MNKKINALIVGAGAAGELLAKEIARTKSSSFKVVGFVDDKKKSTEKLKVLGKIKDIGAIACEYGIEEVIIAVPSGRGKLIRSVIENSSGLGLKYKILPRLSEVLSQEYEQSYLKYLRTLRAEDLLGGEISKSDQEGISQNVKDQVIMITGAAGSIGSELSRQLASYGPKKIIFYDWWENGMFDLSNHVTSQYPKLSAEFIIGDVKDKIKLNCVLKRYEPSTIFHAAAYKHVPLMEINPVEAIKNNIFGTRNVAKLAIKHGVKKFVLVSTDKAVNPTNIMGATKRAAEKIIHTLSDDQSGTVFCSVRFGNVVNSNGSALPTFQKQIEKGGPVTVTHREITRYFMTIPEAVHLILQAWTMGQPDDLFVLDMGEPVKIYDLAKIIISMNGYAPDQDIKIKITGLRPGEKLYEEVLVKEEDVSATSVNKIFKTKNYHNFNELSFLKNLSLLKELVEEDGMNEALLKEKIKELVSTYQPHSDKK